MASVTLYKIDGTTAGQLDLPDGLFDAKISPSLVHEAVVSQSANSRAAIAHTKDRSEVRGGGRKPWKQKGTGRARHGSSRSPIWSGGGVTFGPSNLRNFAKKMNRKARRKALAMVLTDKVKNDKLIALESLVLTDVKTKTLTSVIANFPISGKKTLIITTPENRTILKAAQNIQAITTMPANTLNVIDLLRYEYVMVTKDALDFISKHYSRA